MLIDVAHRQKQLNEVIERLQKLVAADDFKCCAIFIETRGQDFDSMYAHADGGHHVSLSLLGHIGIWKSKMEVSTFYNHVPEPEEPPPAGS